MILFLSMQKLHKHLTLTSLLAVRV